jgi:hypothetical protein
MLTVISINGVAIKSKPIIGQNIHTLYTSSDGRFIVSATSTDIIIYHSLNLDIVSYVEADSIIPITSLAISPNEVG